MACGRFVREPPHDIAAQVCTLFADGHHPGSMTLCTQPVDVPPVLAYAPQCLVGFLPGLYGHPCVIRIADGPRELFFEPQVEGQHGDVVYQRTCGCTDGQASVHEGDRFAEIDEPLPVGHCIRRAFLPRFCEHHVAQHLHPLAVCTWSDALVTLPLVGTGQKIQITAVIEQPLSLLQDATLPVLGSHATSGQTVTCHPRLYAHVIRHHHFHPQVLYDQRVKRRSIYLPYFPVDIRLHQLAVLRTD